MADLSQFVEQVKNRLDIGQCIGRVVPSLKKAGSNTMKGLCPFHNENTPSFTVNLASQHYHCFGCGASGDTINFVMETENFDFITALEKLASEVGLTLPELKSNSEGSRIKKAEKEENFRIMDEITLAYINCLSSPQGEEARQYLAARGMSPEDIKKYQIGFAPEAWDFTSKFANKTHAPLQKLGELGFLSQNEKGHSYDRFRNRIMFPIHNELAQVVAFSGRLLHDDKSQGGKYINSPETAIFKKSEILYGLHVARKAVNKDKPFILCEGQMDVIACHRAGLTNAIAAQGTALTEAHVRKIIRFHPQVKICFDADAAGLKASWKACQLFLTSNLVPSFILLDEDNDPDSILSKSGASGLTQTLDKALSITEFLSRFFHLNANTNLEQKILASEEIISLASLCPDPVKRDFILSEMANTLKVDKGSLQEKTQQIIKQRYRREQQSQNFKQGEKNTPAPIAEAPNNIPTSLSAKMLIQRKTPVLAAEIEMLSLLLADPEFAFEIVEKHSTELASSGSIFARTLQQCINLTELGKWNACDELIIKTFTNEADIVRLLLDSRYRNYHAEELAKSLTRLQNKHAKIEVSADTFNESHSNDKVKKYFREESSQIEIRYQELLHTALKDCLIRLSPESSLEVLRNQFNSCIQELRTKPDDPALQERIQLLGAKINSYANPQ